MEEFKENVSTSNEIKNNWRFVSIVQFVNLFKNVINIDPISTLEMENSLRHPEIEPQCLNILLKLLMKKALFKPHLKIGENFDLKNFEEMLLKKINFLYKTYIRYLKKMNNVNENSRIYELLTKDIEEYREKEKGIYKLNSLNLSENQFDDLDLKNLMVIEFFRSLGGRNPFLKTCMQSEKMEIFLNGGDKEEIVEYNIVDINNQNLEIINENIQENLQEDFLTFSELSLQDKVDILFFFCNYSLTLSGRSNLFREELMKDSKDPINIHVNNKRIKPLGKDSENNLYYSLLCNRDCKIYKENEDGGLEIVVKNYEDLEKFLIQLENEILENKNKTLIDNTKELIKNIKENLLQFKENSEEESKREQNFSRKQQALDKAKMLKTRQGSEIDKYANSDYFHMNISDKVITRNQLNRITRSTLNTSQVVITTSQTKTQLVNDDERKKIKIEKEKLEREKRLEKRNRIFERNKKYENNDNNLSKHKRKRTRLGRRPNKISSDSEDEYSSSTENDNENPIILASDKEDIEEDLQLEEEINPGEPNDIILEGNLIYRFINNQVELDGHWFMSQDTMTREKLSFLFQKSHEYLEFPISSHEIEYNEENQQIKDFFIKICCSNIHECITINKINLFNSVLEFLSGEYAGYFMYYGKTIEDRVNISLNLEDSLVRVNGEGTNSLGNFSIIGYMNFFRNKEILIEKNDLNTEVIKLAEFKFTKIYTAFNPNENYRVIKSYQHRRKKMDDDSFY